MNAFGAGGLMLCFMIGGLMATLEFGWPALVSTVLMGIGFLRVLSIANNTFYPDGTLRPQKRRRARRNQRW